MRRGHSGERMKAPQVIGAIPLEGGETLFRVWAPLCEKISVRLFGAGKSRVVPLEAEEWGYFSAVVTAAKAGDRYLYILGSGDERPDPASRSQPEGVHGPSEIVDPAAFRWSDNDWKGLPLPDYIIYELHVGTFTAEGTFEAAIPELDRLVELGVTAVELMPVAQFPGGRNWGYDGVYPYAPQNSYGGPQGLKMLVDACHRRRLAVILDTVYNHLGPEGNYLHSFGPYFTDRYRTPWGEAINLDGPDSDEVRRFFIGNALYWVKEFRLDALRLDAVHGIFDFGARHFLAELASEVGEVAKKEGREIHVIAESDQNDSRLIKPERSGGYGLAAQWSDDFHHALHTLLTGENDGYYVDFGRTSHFARALKGRYVYSGEYSRYRSRRHGNSAKGRPPRQFVVCSQNHDQVGNRMFGERLSSLVSFDSLKLAAGAILLSPYVPLLFMGEEYGEDAPFLYFVSHGAPGLTEAVRRGRIDEFRSFVSRGEPPDPGAIDTFHRSRLHPEKRNSGNHALLYRFYRELIALRKSVPPLSVPQQDSFRVSFREREKTVSMERWHGEERAFCLFNFNETAVRLPFPAEGGVWRKAIDSAEGEWNGPGSGLPARVKAPAKALMAGRSCALYLAERKR